MTKWAYRQGTITHEWLVCEGTINIASVASELDAQRVVENYNSILELFVEPLIEAHKRNQQAIEKQTTIDTLPYTEGEVKAYIRDEVLKLRGSAERMITDTIATAVRF